MQRIAVIVPFPNIAVEYELHKLVENNNIIYQIFKIDYNTHQKDNEIKFYQELKENLDLLIDKILELKFDKVILMCSSLSSKIDEVKILTVNRIVSNYILKYNLNGQLVLISPYSEKTTQETLISFQNLDVKFESVFSKQLYGSYNYFMFGSELLDFCKKNNIETKKIFISCTNIPVFDSIKDLDVISSNTIVAKYINSL